MARTAVPRKRRETTGEESAKSPSSVYQLKVTLTGSRPPIWRRVLVPAHSTLADLHRIIMALMGWLNVHLHDWAVPSPNNGGPRSSDWHRTALRFVPMVDPAGEPFDMRSGDDDESEDDAAAYLDVVAPALNSRLLYTYDMGDSWEHDIIVEKILPADPSITYPVCIGGRRNGPLEDCGGIYGYQELLTILANPAHPDNAQAVKWLGHVFALNTWDGEEFDLESINFWLRQIENPSEMTKQYRL